MLNCYDLLTDDNNTAAVLIIVLKGSEAVVLNT